jgi:hypothetical protein
MNKPITENDFFEALEDNDTTTMRMNACFELAKRMAIDFANWATGREYTKVPHKPYWYDNEWTIIAETTEQLFELYQQSK